METTATTIDFGHQLNLETYDGPSSVLLSLAVRAFASGELPAARRRQLSHVRADAALVPAGMTPTRTSCSGSTRQLQAEGPGWMLVGYADGDGDGWVTVVAVTDELAADVLAAATEGAEEPVIEDEGQVEARFWHMSTHGARRTSRVISAPTWADIRANYEVGAAGAFDALAALEAPPTSGRLLLLHGPPGTGKTTVLRALARSWRSWCALDVVVDPERAFGNAGYLLDVLASDGDDDRWKLLVLEDCDELVRAEAKASTGQSLARLLNLTDGLVGQGVKALVALTTNERLGLLHPAVTRPGRCIAEVEVGPLPEAHARTWLGRSLPAGTGSATLAELHAWRDGERVATAGSTPVAASGVYL